MEVWHLGDISAHGEARRNKIWREAQDTKRNEAQKFLFSNIPVGETIEPHSERTGTRWIVTRGYRESNIKIGERFCSKFGSGATYSPLLGSDEEFKLEYENPRSAWHTSRARAYCMLYLCVVLGIIGLMLIFRPQWILGILATV